MIIGKSAGWHPIQLMSTNTNRIGKWGMVSLFVLFVVAGCGANRNSVESSVSSVKSPNIKNTEKPILVTSLLDVHSSEIKSEANKLLEAHDFAQIEKVADNYRRSQAMFIDGFWKLGHFYLGLAKVPDSASDAEWEKQCKLILRWATANPKSITAQVALARIYYEGAFRARGYDYANSVSQDQWKTMNQRLDEATKVLTNSASMRNQCPGWYAVAQRIAFLKQRPLSEFDAITNEALRHFPHYYDFYFQKTNYLMPRWFGAKGDWQEYATKIANQMQGDEGDIFYARALWNMEMLVDSENSVELQDFDWARAKHGFNLLLKDPDSFAVAGAFAQAAWLVRDHEQLKSLFDTQIGNHYDSAVWITEQEFQNAYNWAYAN